MAGKVMGLPIPGLEMTKTNKYGHDDGAIGAYCDQLTKAFGQVQVRWYCLLAAGCCVLRVG